MEKLKNSRFFTISLLIHMVLIAMLGSMVLFRAIQEEDDFTAGGGGGFVSGQEESAGPPDQQPVAPQAELVPQPPTIQTPTSSMDVITALTPVTTNFSMTVAPPVVTAPSDVTSKLPVTTKGGTSGPSGLPSGLPGVMAGRAAGAPRDKARREAGGKDKSEEAVMKGLRWLKANQNPDGTWGGTSTRGAMTGLGLLCFLGHGETYFSVEFGEAVKKSVDAFVKEGNAQAGRLAFSGSTLATQNAPYQHGIAVYALSEAYTLTKDDRIPPILTKAVAYIVNGQATDGGWMYKYDRSMPSDTSVGGWQIQALKAAHLTGLNIPGVDETLDKSMLNLERVFDKKKGQFGYRKPEGKLSLTGVGALNILMWKNQKSGMVREAVDSILDNSKVVDYHGEEADLYGWYYHTQACLMYGGGAWTKWNKLFQDTIADSQAPDGSWPVQQKSKHAHGPMKEATVTGNVYRTALCVLMLEVYYRYLPSVKS